MSFSIDSVSEQMIFQQQMREMNADSEFKGRLFHYTTAQGLHGILRDQAIWGTHVAYLNDSQEMQFGIDFVVEIIRAFNQTSDAGSDSSDGTYTTSTVDTVTDVDNDAEARRKKQIDTIRSGLHGIVRQRILNEAEVLRSEHSPFVSCLSRSRDQLSQWRGYANGGGYAVEFNENLLKDSLQQVDPFGEPVEDASKPVLSKVLYATPEAAHIVNRKIENYAAEIMPDFLDDSVENILDKKLSDDFRDWLVSFVANVKHGKFGEELEYRIACRGGQTFVTESSLGLTPRTAFAFAPESLTAIMTGPGMNMEIRGDSVKRFLRSKGDKYAHVEVHQSEVPYREI